MDAEFLVTLAPTYVSKQDPEALVYKIRRWILDARPFATEHPYGFWVILLRRADNEEWRFHLWPQRRPPVTGMPAPIHTHDKVVDSRILKGALENITYLLRPTETGGLPIYEARHVSDKYSPENKNILCRTPDRFIPEVAARQNLGVGHSYNVPPHVFHEARVFEGDVTCTIVRMHSQAPGPAKILGADGYPGEIEFKRAFAPAAELILAAGV
jgi:hypothetical protein